MNVDGTDVRFRAPEASATELATEVRIGEVQRSLLQCLKHLG
jgi:hypothetical protein